MLLLLEGCEISLYWIGRLNLHGTFCLFLALGKAKGEVEWK